MMNGTATEIVRRLLHGGRIVRDLIDGAAVAIADRTARRLHREARPFAVGVALAAAAAVSCVQAVASGLIALGAAPGVAFLVVSFLAAGGAWLVFAQPPSPPRREEPEATIPVVRERPKKRRKKKKRVMKTRRAARPPRRRAA